MYRYLFERECFNRILSVNEKITPKLNKKIKEIIADTLDVEFEDVELIYYKKTENGVELRFEGKKEIGENFVFRVIIEATELETTLIHLKTFISRVIPTYLAGPVLIEDLVYNIIQKFSEKSFYKDLMSEYKLKYEEVSKKLYEGLELLFDFGDNISNQHPQPEGLKKVDEAQIKQNIDSKPKVI